MARYIDADAAAELARLTYCKNCNSYNGVMCRACAFDDAMSFIDDFPGAEVAPKNAIIDEFTNRLKEKLYTVPTVYNAHFSKMIDAIVTEMKGEGE